MHSIKPPALKFNTLAHGRPGLAARLALGAAVVALWAPAARAVNIVVASTNNTALPITQTTRGGVDPHSFIYSLTKTQLTGGVKAVELKWYGFGAPYQVMASTNLGGTNWTPVGRPVDGQSATVPLDGHHAFLRVTNLPYYLGSDECIYCHQTMLSNVNRTAHAGALGTLQRIGMGANKDCLPCHTVGYGYGSGYSTNYPWLANVQCENCHGPSGDHANYPQNRAVLPVANMSAKICGGCHNEAHHPTYDEWSESGHAAVSPDVASGILAGDTNRAATCGACHSGAARLYMLMGKGLPPAKDAGTVGVVCVVCHDPHQTTANPAQLRNPLSSLIPFSYSTAKSFASQYNSNVMVCAQCHNDRAAVWTSTSRPPHHSPQYNILIGSTGVTNSAATVGSHRLITNQCTQCHVHRVDAVSPTEANPNYTGHGFEPRMTACAPCHTPERAAALTNSVQQEFTQQIADTKFMLDLWATSKAPSALRKYGTLAWEFSTPGALGNPSASTAITGPTTAEQASIPNDIKQARFNLYLVLHDGSLGVHNATYCRNLLMVAQNKVLMLLIAP